MFDEKQDGYWVPVDGEVDQDYDYVSNADVLNRLGSIEARHKLLISDSCFSGNLLTRGMSPVSPSELRKPGYYLQKNRLKSVQGFTSGGDEPVYDGGPRWGGNSVFAYHLIAQLEANQQQYSLQPRSDRLSQQGYQTTHRHSPGQRRLLLSSQLETRVTRVVSSSLSCRRGSQGLS